MQMINNNITRLEKILKEDKLKFIEELGFLLNHLQIENKTGDIIKVKLAFKENIKELKEVIATKMELLEKLDKVNAVSHLIRR
ncbi:hypothetical protein HMPREF0202_01544 [Cetobacterium somerae ATCC BAA-474]|uniref:Uncharacterized protein n=2 Tax=Cetobacterium TaxID=180162 RepID=U7VAJ9_9FUSO|nr:hypothetical protein HMPREF0202_01544 [Cetobacterium somerae ATCC BAA-474]